MRRLKDKGRIFLRVARWLLFNETILVVNNKSVGLVNLR